MENASNCQICGTSKSKYSCPKCHIAFCSVSCYQSDGHTDCSELFYKEWVHEELKNCHSESEAREKMLEILKKNQDSSSEEYTDSDDDDDDDEVPDLASRMTGIDLDDEEAVWENLTPEERKEFRKLVESGSIMNVVSDQEPWWKTKKRETLISDCDKDHDWKSKCPPIPSDIPKVTIVEKPSPCVPFMLLNVLMSYVVTVRWFKGVHETLPVEAISTCIALSATLRKNEVFKNHLEAFIAVQNDLSQCEWVKDGSSMDTMEEDLADIIKGSDGDDLFFCLKAVICDLNSLCSKSLDILKQESGIDHSKRFSGPPPKVNLLKQISKRMIYYLSWIGSHGSLMLKTL